MTGNTDLLAPPERRPVGVLPDHAHEPAMSASLGHMVRLTALRGPEEAFSRMTSADQGGAHKLAAYYVRATGPLQRDRVETWLRKVALAVSRPPSDGDLAARIDSVMGTSGDLCVAAWTEETRARFCRVTQWWPADAEVDAFLRPISDAFRSKRRALEWAASHPVAGRSGAWTAPSEGESAAVRSAVQQVQAAFAENSAAMEGDRPTGICANHLSLSSLLKVYEEAAKAPGVGQAAAQFRVERLREQLQAARARHRS